MFSRQVARLSTILLSVVLTTSLLGQSTAKPSFEVATIKPSRFPQTEGISLSPAHFIATGFALWDLVQLAYSLDTSHLEKASGWIASDRYDIQAKADAATIEALSKLSDKQQEEQALQMLRSLLEERFKLKLRTEQRTLPVYLLKTAKDGPHMTSVPSSVPGSLAVYNGGFRSKGITMHDFARYLNVADDLGGHEIVDQTGLTDNYALDIKWSPMNSTNQTGPSIFTALQEQLGLRLEPAKVPAEVYIIESAEKPSAN